MHIYLLKRLGLALLVALFVSVLAFGLLRLQGDAASALAGEGASEADIAIIIGIDHVKRIDMQRVPRWRRRKRVNQPELIGIGRWHSCSLAQPAQIYGLFV